MKNYYLLKNNTIGIIVELKNNKAKVLYNSKLIETNVNSKVYLGDKVLLDLEKSEIKEIIKRTNILSREKYDRTKISDKGTSKIIAANIDIAVIVVSANNPPFHPKLIDRYSILLQSNNIPFIVVLNKCDLKDSSHDEILNIYRNLNIEIIETSVKENIGINKLKNTLKNKQAILVGHSGVGKSSLINAIMDNDNIKVGSIGNKSKRGCHTTTSSNCYLWNNSSIIIDTPGIRSLDLRYLKKEELQNYFKEINDLKEYCKYKNCLHHEENIDNCYIKQAVSLGKISKYRYDSYIKILEELK